MKSTVLCLGIALIAGAACGSRSGCGVTAKPIQGAAPSKAKSTNDALERHVAEMARASDVRNYAVRLEEEPPAGFVPFELSAERLPLFASPLLHDVRASGPMYTQFP